MIRRFAIVFSLLPVLATAAPELRRGLNLDPWVDWLPLNEVLAPGFLDPYPDWGRHVSDQALPGIKAAGFDFVRFAIDPAPMIALGPGAARSQLIAGIRKQTDAMLAMGLDVIVDLHAMPLFPDGPYMPQLAEDPNLFAAHLDLVTEVGAALDGLDPDRVAFEPINEPVIDCDTIWGGGDGSMRWPEMLIAMHAAARAGAPDLAIVLSGACWGGVDGLERIDPATLKDDNLIWSFHSYDPFLFTHQGAVWTDGVAGYFDALTYPPAAVDDATAAAVLDRARARLAARPSATVTDEALVMAMEEYRSHPDDWTAQEPARAAAWADLHGIPRGRLLLGEFGAMQGGGDGVAATDPLDRAEFLADKARAAEALGIGWAAWSWSGTFGLSKTGPDRRLDPDLCRALLPEGCG